MRRVQSHATRPMLNCSSNFCLGITSSCRSAKPLGCWGCVRCIDAIVSKGVARTLNPYCPICVRTFCTTPRTPPHVHPTPPRLPHLPPHTRPHFTPPHTSAHPPAAGERAHTYLGPPLYRSGAPGLQNGTVFFNSRLWILKSICSTPSSFAHLAPTWRRSGVPRSGIDEGGPDLLTLPHVDLLFNSVT